MSGSSINAGSLYISLNKVFAYWNLATTRINRDLLIWGVLFRSIYAFPDADVLYVYANLSCTFKHFIQGARRHGYSTNKLHTMDTKVEFFEESVAYACVKGHLEPTHLKSSPLFTFLRKSLRQDSPSIHLFSKIIRSRFTITKIKLDEDSPSWFVFFLDQDSLSNKENNKTIKRTFVQDSPCFKNY